MLLSSDDHVISSRSALNACSMIKNVTIFCFLIGLCSCKKDNIEICSPFVIPTHGPELTLCVIEEEIGDSLTIVPTYAAGDKDFGDATAVKINKHWEASARLTERGPDIFGLSFQTFSSKGFLRESFSLVPVTLSIGCYQIDTTSHEEFTAVAGFYSIWTDDGDALEDYYRIDLETRNSNLLEITDVDNANRTLKGKFSVSFVISTAGGKNNPLSPDRVRFLNGSFEVEIP